MKKHYLLILSLLLFAVYLSQAQTFVRAELTTELTTPWEMTYGSDNFLWVTERDGKIARIDPITGERTIVYTAIDYFSGSELEAFPICFNPPMGKGTFGLTLHPDFINGSPYVYFFYSYNSGTEAEPATKFRIKRLEWDAMSSSVVDDTNIVNGINSSYDHWGGRLLAIEQNDIPYLFLTVGDHGLSDLNSPDCYPDQSLNPNQLAQDPTTQNGKIHRFNMDGTIPADNPIAGNSFYTRGHRNPQGLMYNPTTNIIYSVEHGDRNDDEINVLHKGMNYGWKNVQGYHSDNNVPGEADYVANYTPHPSIPNDSLVEAFYSWCPTESSSSPSGTNWCTVAPCDGIYYGSDGIAAWNNSLLVVTLKDGVDTDREVYQFKLTPEGDLMPSTVENPNPKKFFGEDQGLNGRLRDITISPDGKTIYLLNSAGVTGNKIITYTLVPNSVNLNDSELNNIQLFPNPAQDVLMIKGAENLSDIRELKIMTINGVVLSLDYENNKTIDISTLPSGLYFVNIIYNEGSRSLKFIKK